MNILHLFKWGARKCERVGHLPHTVSRRTYRYPPESRYAGVADRCREERIMCMRCDTRLSDDWQVVERRPIASLEMSGSSWDRLKADGVLEL